MTYFFLMSSVFLIFTQPRSQDGVKKDVLKFSTHQENIWCQFQATMQSYLGVFQEKSHNCSFLLNQHIILKGSMS